MSRATSEEFLDPGEFNDKAVSPTSVTQDRYEAVSDKLVRERHLDTPLFVPSEPCQFLFEGVRESESGCAEGVRQICLHPNHARSRKLWGELVLMTDRLKEVIDEMQTWAEHEAGITGNRKIIKPVNPLVMAGKIDRLHGQLEQIRGMLKESFVKPAKNYSDKGEFTAALFEAKSDEDPTPTLV